MEMNILVVAIGVAVVSLAVGGVLGSFFKKRSEAQKIAGSKSKSDQIIEDAEKQAKTIKKEAELEGKDILLKSKTQFERETQEKQKELQTLEKRLISREENLEKKFDLLESKEDDLKKQEQSLLDRKKHAEALEKQYHQLVDETKKKLEKVAGLSMDDAKRQLKESLVEEVKADAAKMIKDIEDEAREKGEKESQYIMSSAMERMASDFVSEHSISVVHLPSDEMKGRIIGREGRNIRALEAATGIDIVIDDTPEAVVLSGFNPIRREVARRTLESLIQDGRIHPARIEDMVSKMEKEINAEIKEAGDQAGYELGLHNVHPELLKLVGSLKFRFSYGQNVLQHSKEVAYLAGMMAAQLGIDEKMAKRAGLLHDIGKAVSHEVEGSHALIGMEYAKKYRESEPVVHAIGAHHEDLQQDSAFDCLIDAADALSGARPGARREVLETYVKRLDDLENISRSFKGVEKAYAIQAGREIRVMVDNDKLDDSQANVLSRDIAKKIEAEMTYPGQIKVTVIRETRSVDYAK